MGVFSAIMFLCINGFEIRITGFSFFYGSDFCNSSYALHLCWIQANGKRMYVDLYLVPHGRWNDSPICLGSTIS